MTDNRYFFLSGIVVAILAATALGFAMYTVTKPAPEVSVLQAKVLPEGKGENTTAFVDIVNKGGGSDKLIGVTSNLSSRAELHTYNIKTEKSKKVNSFNIPANDETQLTGEEHVMLINLDNTLEFGDTVELTLEFERSGKLSVNAPVTQEDGHLHTHGGHE